MRRLSLLVLPLLAACATPQQSCIASATRDIRVLDGLIARAEVDLARGYTVEERVLRTHRYVPCAVQPAVAKGAKRTLQFCWEDHDIVRSEPRAIDIPAETRKLAAMREKRAALASAAVAQVAACKESYPETAG
ncbi:MAG: hypothetical protein R3D84_11060 [Paracoccaceae bacterium]